MASFTEKISFKICAILFNLEIFAIRDEIKKSRAFCLRAFYGRRLANEALKF